MNTPNQSPAAEPVTKPAAVIVDWGTTSFRADLVTGAGEVLGHVETPQGISELGGRGFEAVLMAALGPWRSTHGPLPVVALGMITSRNGWVEVPYVPCPAGPSTSRGRGAAGPAGRRAAAPAARAHRSGPPALSPT
jgi:2-keto-3-deoxy-galactonokinase